MKNIFKKMFSLLASFVMLCTITACKAQNVIVKTANTKSGSLSGSTVILHSNDTHGNIEGFAYMTALKTMYEDQGATVILVDAGDFTQGEISVSTSKGANATKVMDIAGYDIVALGNHELDYGFEQLKSNVEGKNFKVTCCDVFYKNKAIFDEYDIVKVGDLKIGFYGLLTPETQTKVNPGLIQGLSFAAGEELINAASKVQAKLEKKTDLQICLGHLGVDDESVGHRSTDILPKLAGLDYMIDGHSHTVMPGGTDGLNIQQTGTKFENVGFIRIDNSTKKIVETKLIPCEGLNKDSNVYAQAKAIVDEVEALYSTKFASSLVALDGTKAHVRAYETNLGDLIADSMVWSVLNAGSLEVADDMIVAITNGGGIRADIAVGDVTMKDVNTVLPFGNTIAVDYVTGEELLESLEASTYCTPETVGGFPQVAGIKFTLDTSITFDQGELYPESTYYAPKSIKRVTINEINGKPFDKNATYAVITNNFCAAGGDTYYAFKKAYDAGKGFDTSIPLDEGLQNFITEKLGGIIGNEYASPKGRIIIK